MSLLRYKYCIVPKCTNTTVTAPEKIFFSVPRKDLERKKWCIAMKRDEKKNPALSTTSTRNVCQDHFDLELDTDNYLQHKLQGSRLKLKVGTVPHIFECQINKPLSSVPSTERATKRQRKKTVEELIKAYESSTSSDGICLMENEIDPVEVLVTTEDIALYSDKACQINLKASYRSKSTNTSSVTTSDFGCTARPEMYDKACGSTMNVQECAQEICTLSDAEEIVDTDYVCENSSGSDYELEQDDDKNKMLIRTCMVKSVQKNSLMCLGIQEEEIFLIEFLSVNSKCSILNVLITLKKIRQNETYEYLGMLFGMSINNVSRIFKETLFHLAGVLQNFIIWPSDKISIKLCLPVAFRKSFHNVQSIIDCFEIPIEKPSNSFFQSMTWSEYYKANTIKFLVSCTPDGTVSFISRGYGGRATDAAIVEDSGYLKMLFPHMDVMADRGFKNIAYLLQQSNCQLIRPPSVSQNEPMSEDEVKCTRRIAAVRVHVERVINKLRNFSILSKHTCVDNQLIQLFDHILIVVCGIINCQNKIIKV